MQITLQPQVLRWARERAGLETVALAKKVGVKPDRVEEWEESGRIRIAQVEKLAHHTHTPLGYLYLNEPVEERLPIPDFRTIGDRPLTRPSPDLLETLYAMLRRQEWMRDELIEHDISPLEFVGRFNLRAADTDVAESIRETLGLETNWADAQKSWTEAMRHLRDRIETAGVLVVMNGIVGNNTRRKLSPDEFRGFALVNEYAPLIFINGADFKAAQLFTLIHELTHVWIGADGVSNLVNLEPAPNETEQFCNRVAAEFLVPAAELKAVWNVIPPDQETFQFLARRFKVSSIVAARRALDLQLIDNDDFFDFYTAWLDVARREQREISGGDFWNNQNVRIGRRLGAAVLRAVKEGRLLYRDAYSLTGLKGKSFDEYTRQLEAEL